MTATDTPRNGTLDRILTIMSNDMCVTDIAAHLYLVFIYAGLALVFFDLCQVVFWPFIRKSLKKEKEVKEAEEEE